MKRILYITTILLSTLIFLYTFDRYSFYNEADLYNARLKETQPQLDCFSTVVKISSEAGFTNLLDELCSLAHTHKTNIEIQKSSINEQMIPVVDYFIYKTKQSNFLLSMISLDNEEKEIDFTSDDRVYYTNNLQDENACNYVTMISRYKRLDSKKNILNYYPLQSAKRKDFAGDDQIYIRFISDDATGMIEAIERSSISDMVDMDMVKAELQSITNIPTIAYEQKEYLHLMLMISVLSLLLLLMQTVYKKKHFIGIYKLMGVEKKTIIKRLFFKNLAWNVLLYIGIQIILYIVLCGVVRADTLAFIKKLGFYFVFILLLFILVYLLAYVVVGRVNAMNALKSRQNKGRRFYYTGLIMKYLMIILSAASFMMILKVTYVNGENICYYFSRKSFMSEYYQIYQFDNKNVEMNNEILAFAQPYELVYSQAKSIDIFEDDDSFTTIGNELYVNNNALKDYTLYDKNHQSIDLSSKENKTYIYYKDTWLKEHLHIDDEDVEYYYNDIRIHQPTYPSFEKYYEHPVIHRLGDLRHMDENIWLNINANTTVIPAEEYAAFVSAYKQHFEEPLLFTKLEDILNTHLFSDVLTFLRYFILSFIFLYFYYYIVKQCVMIYLCEYGHKISIRYLHGWTFMQRYKELFWVCGIGYAICLMLLMMKMSLWIACKYTLIFFIIDVSITVFYLVKNQTKLIKNNLKGGTLE